MDCTKLQLVPSTHPAIAQVAATADLQLEGFDVKEHKGVGLMMAANRDNVADGVALVVYRNHIIKIRILGDLSTAISVYNVLDGDLTEDTAILHLSAFKVTALMCTTPDMLYQQITPDSDKIGKVEFNCEMKPAPVPTRPEFKKGGR